MNKLTNLALVAGLSALALTACGGGDSAAGFCDSLVRLEDSGVDPDSDFDGAIRALEDIKSNAPDDLKVDLDTFIEVMNKVNDAGDDADFNDFAGDLENMTAAVERIQDYADENCEDLPGDLFN